MHSEIFEIKGHQVLPQMMRFSSELTEIKLVKCDAALINLS
jgi:hypothetical protein